MTTISALRPYRFPIEIIEQCVWLYFRFALSYCNIEETMAKRGVQVTSETIREWCYKFGSVYAAWLRKSELGLERSGTWTKSSSDEWSPALLMAGCGPERSGHRYPGAAVPRPSGKALHFFRKLLHTAESTARHHHGLATELCCSEEADFV